MEIPDPQQLLESLASALWFLANICYVGMRAQGHPSRFWRVLSFVAGWPGTSISLWVVHEGSEHAYGIDLPRRRDNAR